MAQRRKRVTFKARKVKKTKVSFLAKPKPKRKAKRK